HVLLLRRYLATLPYSSTCLSIDPAPTLVPTLSLHDALPISMPAIPMGERSEGVAPPGVPLEETIALPGTVVSSSGTPGGATPSRSEEHTSELQSLAYLVCRLLLEKKKKNRKHEQRNKQHERQ